MKNRENIEVLISEARRSVIDERELFSRRKEDIQRQREERQEEEFQKRAEKRRTKSECSWKNKVMTLLTIACAN